MTISEKLFNILSDRGISQKDLAEMTGISQSTISDWKRKGTNPAADKIVCICDALDISVYELLNEGQNEKNKQLDYVVIHKESSEYALLDAYHNLDKSARERLIGYMEALQKK